MNFRNKNMLIFEHLQKILFLGLIIFNSTINMSDNEDFLQGDAGSSDTVPSQAGAIKKNGYCMLKGFPCKVTEYSTAKPGKHGSAKATIVGNDIFTGKRYEEVSPTSANIQVPIVTKIEYEVADIGDDEFVSLILQDGSLKTDLKLPVEYDLAKELRKVFDDATAAQKQTYFTIIRACGQEKIIAGRSKQ